MPRALLVAVIALGVVLTLTVVPAPFTIDENNYLVTVLGLRHGQLTVPNTEGLPATRELLYFDPNGFSRVVRSTPVSSIAPPLWAPIALPFSFLGWRGLTAINTLAFLATILLCFVMAREGSASAQAPWLAALAVGAGAYFIEYAQGVWPHMLAVALVAAGALTGLRAMESGGWAWAAPSGFLAALAAGVRYQNAFVLGCLGLGLLLFSRRRIQVVAAFALGAFLPLAASSVMNHERHGSWNPISKGPGYLVSVERMKRGEGSFAGKVATMAWARIVDYSARPPLGGVNASFMTPQPRSGAYVMVTAVKKAWLQSSPWLIISLSMTLIAWFPRRWFERLLPDAPQRSLRVISLIVVPTLAMFSSAGVSRTDGLCFNQRYFCEMVPLLAVAMAWCIGDLGSRRTVALAGALFGALLGMAALAPHHLAPLRHYLVMYLPLGLASLLALAWGLWLSARWRGSERAAHSAAVAAVLGACLAWGLVAHVGDDVPASRLMRRSRQDYLRQLRPFIKDHSALMAGGALKDALGPLQLDLDVVIAVPGFDKGEAVGELMDAFLARGRNVFIAPNSLPQDMMNSLLEGRMVRALGQPTALFEVRAGDGNANEREDDGGRR